MPNMYQPSTIEGPVTFQANGAIGQGIRVKVDSTLDATTGQVTVSIAGAADKSIGTARDAAVDNGQVTVLPISGVSGVYVSAGAVALGSLVKGTAAGKVDDAVGTGEHLGIALNAAAAVDEWVLVMHSPNMTG